MKRLPKNKSRHHRVCASRGGSNLPENISIVTKKKHQAWHTLFTNMTPHEIATEISNIWIDPRYKMEVVIRDEE